MKGEAVKTLVTGVVFVIVGISGWLLPYRWNLLRLQRSIALMLSEEMDRRMPRILGTVMVFVGLGMVIVALL